PRYNSARPFCRPNPETSQMVMPPMPRSARASRTSSSLNGFIMASIFFMVPRRTMRNAKQVRSHAQKRSKDNAMEIRRVLLVLKINPKPVFGPPKPAQLSTQTKQHGQNQPQIRLSGIGDPRG